MDLLEKPVGANCSLFWRRVSRAAWFVAVTVLCLAAAAPLWPAARAGEGQNDEIIIGATFPLTGYLDYYGQSAYYGANTKVNQINAEGGINGKRLVLKWRDNKSDPQQAARDAEDMIDEYGVPAMLGPLLSDSAIAIREVANRRGVVFVSPMAAVDALTKDTSWIFRSCFNNTSQAKGMVMFQMRNFGASTCAIIYDPRHSFSNELSVIFDKTFSDAGGTVMGTLSMVDSRGEKDYESPLKQLAEAKPDFIYCPSYGVEATELVHAARDLGIRIRFAGPHTWDNELLYEASGKRLAGTSISSVLFEKSYNYPPFQKFYRGLEAAGMDVPDAMAAGAYDAVGMIAEGLKNGETPEKIREGIRALNRFPLATGVTTVLDSGDTSKPVIIRFVEERRGRMIPTFAEMFQID